VLQDLRLEIARLAARRFERVKEEWRDASEGLRLSLLTDLQRQQHQSHLQRLKLLHLSIQYRQR
jgi:hypothetical protein